MDLITDAERLALDTLDDFANIILCSIVEQSEESKALESQGVRTITDDDADEICKHIRALQHIIAHNVAARAVPGQFRLLGLTAEETAGRVHPAPFVRLPDGRYMTTREYEEASAQARLQERIQEEAERVRKLWGQHVDGSVHVDGSLTWVDEEHTWINPATLTVNEASALLRQAVEREHATTMPPDVDLTDPAMWVDHDGVFRRDSVGGFPQHWDGQAGQWVRDESSPWDAPTPEPMDDRPHQRPADDRVTLMDALVDNDWNAATPEPEADPQ